ncbi:MAG: sigma-54 dependent transcriptional regulator [Candidatus Sumerlaeota bacterium]|nr:sigma-54 dependent transcriptional regulator [Candidatus Sumerlaeota bacterium]
MPVISPRSRYPASAGTVAVVDDEPNMCKILNKILRAEGYHVVTYTDSREALEQIRQAQPDVLLTDIRMPEVDGMDVLKAVKRDMPQTQVLVMTGYGTIDGAKEALREGALDYVTKPFRTDELLLAIQKAMEHKRLVEENISLTEVIRRTSPADTLVGDDAKIGEIRAMVDRIAATESAVLIRGESGTGKEIVARAIHNKSGRPGRFVPINCASIPENLMESELFGYEQGAFTGADQRKLGLIELATGGTLFLDEVGELPPALQVKLLRVLQEREIQRVGSLRTIPVDIRLLAATNRNLKTAIDEGLFRTDLYYRLNVINLRLPPLRERVGDIAVLAAFFLERFGRKMNRPDIAIAPDALEALKRYRWPGNVRELENVIERMVVLSDSATLRLPDVPPDILGHATPPTGFAAVAIPAQIDSNQPYLSARRQFESAYIEKLLERTEGNVSEAARLSGISRRSFYEKIERLGINPHLFKKSS